MDLHPLIVHFPIAVLWLAGGIHVVDLIKQEEFYARGASLLHLVGLIAVVIAIISGLNATPISEVSEVAATLMNRHKLAGYGTLWIFGLLYVWEYIRGKKKGKSEKWVFVLLFFLSLVFMSWGASMGGDLVYGHGVGVQLVQ